MNAIRKFRVWMSPEKKVSEDGRQEWGSRTSYLLASMGGAISFGNLLRFPSVVFNNNGIQWFIPYLMAISLLAIPVLVLEIALGQAYRTGSTIAYNGVSKRARGVGLGMVMVGYVVCIYYVPLLAYLMNYFRNSFKSPLPWTGDAPGFYTDSVIANTAPIPGSFTSSGDVESFASYPGTGIIEETLGWTAFSWFVVWLCIFKGVAVTGKIVYFSMGLPIIVVIILIGRGCSLPDAGRGIKLYFGEFNGEKLASGQIWQAATGQVFYSTGVGFGYFTAYASYNSRYADAVQDAIIICCCNAAFETIAAFAVFGIVGYLGLTPADRPNLGSFELGFQTLPAGLAQMPAANFWSVLFFFTLFLLGVSSSFVMLDALITTICDTEWGSKFKHVTVTTTVTIVSFLLSIMYCTEFGDYLLNAVDRWSNNVAIVFIVWAQCVAATTLYRYKDVIGQVGLPAYLVHHTGYLLGMLFGMVLAHAVTPGAGAGIGLGLYAIGALISLLLAKTPDSTPPRFWGRNRILSRFWWLGLYAGNQLRRDLNSAFQRATVDDHKKWQLPVWWAPILRYVTAPILAIVWSFGYPEFHRLRNDPLDIFGFFIAHLIPTLVVATLIVPKFLNVFIPASRRNEGDHPYAPQVILYQEEVKVGQQVEEGNISSDGTSETIAEDSRDEAKQDSNEKDGKSVVR